MIVSDYMYLYLLTFVFSKENVIIHYLCWNNINEGWYYPLCLILFWIITAQCICFLFETWIHEFSKIRSVTICYCLLPPILWKVDTYQSLCGGNLFTIQNFPQITPILHIKVSNLNLHQAFADDIFSVDEMGSNQNSIFEKGHFKVEI